MNRHVSGGRGVAGESTDGLALATRGGVTHGLMTPVIGERRGNHQLIATELAPIGLDEINAEAALLTRVDTKYLVPQPLFAAFVRSSLDRLRILTIDGQRSFPYRSVYFDTPDLACFRAHVQRRRRRFKVRTRTYGQSGECLLEVKSKAGRSETVKTRLPYAADSAAVLTPSGQSFVRDIVPEAEIDRFDVSLETRYVRVTLLDVETRSRLTADTSLTFHRGVATATLDDTKILVETKSVDGAGPTDRWLWRHRMRPVSISKYCAGLAMLHPDARANPWHRVLNRHFIWG